MSLNSSWLLQICNGVTHGPYYEGVNFINILHATFSYKSVLCCVSLITVWLCNFLIQECQSKSCSLIVDEIDYRRKKLCLDQLNATRLEFSEYSSNSAKQIPNRIPLHLYGAIQIIRDTFIWLILDPSLPHVTCICDKGPFK